MLTMAWDATLACSQGPATQAEANVAQATGPQAVSAQTAADQGKPVARSAEQWITL